MTRAAKWIALGLVGVFAIVGIASMVPTVKLAAAASRRAPPPARPSAVAPAPPPTGKQDAHSDAYNAILKFEEDERVQSSLSLARSNLQEVLKDPEDARYQNVFSYPAKIGNANWYVYCGQINPKNGYGGYVGYQRFIAGPWGVEFESKSPNFEQLAWKWCGVGGAPAHW
jgi:hypothetical protein